MLQSVCSYPLYEVKNLIHGGIGGDPLINVCDNIHAHITQQVPRLVLSTDLEEEKTGDEECDLLDHCEVNEENCGHMN